MFKESEQAYFQMTSSIQIDAQNIIHLQNTSQHHNGGKNGNGDLLFYECRISAWHDDSSKRGQ
jgi:hypothetical protein